MSSSTSSRPSAAFAGSSNDNASNNPGGRGGGGNGQAGNDPSSGSASASSSCSSSQPGGSGHHGAGGGRAARTGKSLAPKGGKRHGRNSNNNNNAHQHQMVHHGGGRNHHHHHPHPHPQANKNGAKNYQNFPPSSSKRPSGGRGREGGGHYGHFAHGHEMMEADEFEVGSVFKAGSKKTNMNHLLNFQYEPRGSGRRGLGPGTGPGGKGGRGKKGAQLYHRPKYNKEHYLQANCQFVVRAGADYSAHLSDPDTLVDWALIEQVNLKTSSVPSCPICLDAPRAAKVTRCGHVFCWPCILHYLALSDHATRKCPICNDAIHKDDLKSVVSLLHEQINVGDEIEMTLMRRERHSLFAVPAARYSPVIEKRHPTLGQAFTAHSQLVLASPAEVADQILAREKRDLERQLREEGDQPEACFIEEALRYHAEREMGVIVHQEAAGLGGLMKVHEDNKAALSPEPEADASPSPDNEDFPSLESALEALAVADDERKLPQASALVGSEEDGARPQHLSSSSDGGSSIDAELDLDSPAITHKDLDLSALQPTTSECEAKVEGEAKVPAPGGRPLPKDTFYFYQSSDGQAIFLHALNVQMLVHQYGSFENCPRVIRGRILEKDSSSMTEDLRDKLRYLKHLPVTCNYEVCELDVGAMRLDKDTLKAFDAQLRERRRKRAQRDRLEKRREKLILRENEKKMGKFPEKKIRIESEFHFPHVSDDRSPRPRTVSARSTDSLDLDLDASFGTSPGGNLVADPLVDTPGTHVAVDSTSTGPSFARMLRSGTAKPAAAAEAGFPRSSTFPALAQQSLALAAVAGRRPRADSDSEPEPEGYVAPPPQASFGDSLALALQQHKDKSTAAAAQGNNNGSGKKKGKKNKGVKLNFSAPRPQV